MISQSPIERQLLKKEEIRVGTPWRLLTIAFLTFGISVAIYLGMAFGLQPYLNNRIDNLDSQLQQMANSVSDAQIQGFLTLYSQMVNTNNVLKDRKSPSQLFDFIEKNTLKNIYFTNLSLDYSANTVRVEGKTPDFEILAEQLGVFKNDPSVAKVALSGASLSQDKSGGVKFAAQIDFNK